MNTLRTGVVGVGHMGINHARVYSELKDSQLTAVYDADPGVAQSVARKYKTHAAATLEEFASLVDAATICTPTTTHYEIGKYLLEQGKHLLIEKPIADTPEAARGLSELAAQKSCVLQVGHIERFNPVLAALEQKLQNPRFLEVTRLSPFPNRSTDVGVVLDLMIHDIEIILHLVNSPVVSMDPVGIAVLSKGEDIANVRFHFANGCVANVTASRISRDKVRKIRVFQENAYLSLDYQKQDGVMFRLVEGKKGKEIVRENVEVQRGEPLMIELESFVRCAREGAKPKVSGGQAADALDIALEITRRIQEADPRKNAAAAAALATS
ncbi:MAG: oxidoreductase [Verrucomicrobia bacterium 61-8]|nr:Gfo/Idh/MocA family oxidoreductase [Verrucomicrobiota bacterium]OJV02838.1 MAG: oxidoreductase [Verrucomicrobia bacterium 61-8]